MADAASRTAAIRATARTDVARAQTMLEDFISGLFKIPVRHVRINQDQYSLNSLNGFFSSGTAEYFFKFHQEEGEGEMRGEYYRAGILTRAGLPVDQPDFISTLPGEQILIYKRRADPRFSDILFDLDQHLDAEAMARAIAAEARANDHVLACAKATLVPITPAESGAEPIHRLFYERLIDQGTKRFPGGRLARFYVGKHFAFPNGVTIHWDDLCQARPVINDREYARSLWEMFERAHTRYAPARLADAGGITAHGDAHNANLWYERGAQADRLVFFDPAFAGAKVPALLAEVKASFHNIFAHPFWLYNPELAAQRFTASVRLEAGRLYIETDWRLTEIRQRLLAAKAQHFWKPWLATLAAAGLLPADWEDVIRIGLFLSPTLVMNLNAGEGAERHNPISSAIGFAVALSAGSRPLAGEDLFTAFFDEIRPA
jgi:hypothetical protein